MMNRSSWMPLGIITCYVILIFTGCSSFERRGETSLNQRISSKGPNIVNQKVSPSTIELDRNSNPNRKPVFQAEVMDSDAKVKEVNLKFKNLPSTSVLSSLAMTKSDGLLWKTELSAEQLKALSVSGKTVSYEAIVVAKDEKGNVGSSQSPLILSVKADENAGQSFAEFIPPPTAPLPTITDSPSFTSSDITIDDRQDAPV
jgi:hypothetical protein